MNTIVAFLLVVSCVVAQPFSVTPLSNGTTMSGNVPASSLAMEYYSFEVPFNAAEITVYVTNTASSSGTSTECEVINALVRMDALPCNPAQFASESGNKYLCSSFHSIDDGIPESSSPFSSNFYVGETFFSTLGGKFNFRVNKTVYVGIGSSSVYDVECPYSVKVAVTQECPQGQVASSSGGSSTVTCSPYSFLTTPASTSMNVTTSGYMFATEIPEFTAGLVVNITTAESGLSIYGSSGQPANSYDEECESSGSPSTSSHFIYTLYCSNPQPGNFFIRLPSESASYDVSLTTKFVSCPTGLTGAKCDRRLFTSSSNAMTYPLTSIISGQEEYYTNLYFNLTAGSSTSVELIATTNISNEVRMFVTAGSPNYNVGLSQNAYAVGSSYTLTILPFDLYETGQYYFGFRSAESASVSVTYGNIVATTGSGSVSSSGSSSSGSSSSGSSSSGSSSSGKTSTTSSANSISVCASLIVFMFALIKI